MTCVFPKVTGKFQELNECYIIFSLLKTFNALDEVFLGMHVNNSYYCSKLKKIDSSRLHSRVHHNVFFALINFFFTFGDFSLIHTLTTMDFETTQTTHS